MKHVFSRAVHGRARAWRTARALGVVSALVLVAAPSAVSDDGLPPQEPGRTRGLTYSTGLGSATPAKQYYRVPLTTLSADITYSGADAIASVFAASPAGAPHPYGYFPPITVRTLAFGIVPSEVTLTLAQLRQEIPAADAPAEVPGTGADGSSCTSRTTASAPPSAADCGSPGETGSATENIPVPWMLKGPAIMEGEHLLEGDAVLRIARLTLDGQNVAVGPRCETSTPVHVVLHGQPGYIPVEGGSLAGTVAIPAFTGCGTNGEDLDGLITSMVSGSGNTLEVQQSDIAVSRPLPQNTPAPFPIPKG